MVNAEALPSPEGGGVGVRKPTYKSSREDAHGADNDSIATTAASSEDGSFEGNGGTMATAHNNRSPSSITQCSLPHPSAHNPSHTGPSLRIHRQSPTQDNNHYHSNESRNHQNSPMAPIPVYPQSAASTSNGSGGDVLLQWGQKKRSRCTRPAEKVLSNNTLPLSLAPPLGSRENGRAIVKATPDPILYGKDASGPGFRNRNTEDQARPSLSRNCGVSNGMGAGSRSTGGTGKRSQLSSMERKDKKVCCNYGSSKSRKDKCEDNLNDAEERGGGGGGCRGKVGEGEKESNRGGGRGCGGEVFEWPRIYISLSRKEKEDDFYAMKGTKLPHRPRKRAKAIDRTLQCVFPGLWLSDLTRARYEIRERKSKKAKRRGLKGLESVDSDSE